MTERHDYLWIETGFTDGFRKETETEKTATNPASASNGASATAGEVGGGGPGGVAAPTGVVPAAAAAVGVDGETGKGKGKEGGKGGKGLGKGRKPSRSASRKAKKPKTVEGAGADKPTAKAKGKAKDGVGVSGGGGGGGGGEGNDTRVLDMAFAQKIKDRFLKETGECLALIGMIENESSWAWAKGPENIGKLIAAKSAVDSFKQKSTFFKQLAFNPEFKKSVAKAYTAEDLNAELSQLPQLEAHLDIMCNMRTMILQTAAVRDGCLA